MAERRTEVWLKTITACGLLAAVLVLYTAVTTSRDTFEEGRSRSSNRLLRYERAAEGDCLWSLTAKDSASTLTSPNFPENYPSKIECHWLITADDPNVTISLKINELSIEADRFCRLDYLQVYLGATPVAASLGPFCGNIHNKLIETNASRILLEFQSDLMYEDKGFSIDYFTGAARVCQEALTDASGSLRSLGYPDNYPDHTDCSTLITVSEDKKIILIFDSIDLEFGDNCTFDYVQIFDGRTKESKLLGQICQQTDVKSFESSSSSLLVHFHSDDSVNRKGFRAKYSSLDKRNSAIGDCLWETAEANGTISSPNYPQNYPSSSNCSVWVLAPQGSTVAITVDAILLEMDYNCSFDFLLISEGPSSDSKSLGRLCGIRSEPKQINSTHPEVQIQFQSDNFVEFSGFKLRYHYVKKETVISEKIEDAFDGALTFSATPENVTLSERSSSMLHCSTEHPNARIRWLKGDMFLAGDSPLPGLRFLANDSLWIHSMNRRLVGVYTCVAISPESELSAAAYVFMTGEPSDMPCEAEFRRTPSDSEFEEDDFAHLECLAAGERVQLSWEKDGAPLQMQKHVTMIANGYIFMERIKLQDAGVYTCVARATDSGCVKRASAVLKVTKRIQIEESEYGQLLLHNYE